MERVARRRGSPKARGAAANAPAAASGKKQTAASQTASLRKFSSGSMVQVYVQDQVHVHVGERAQVNAYGA